MSVLTYHEKLTWVQQFVENNVSTIEEFCSLFNVDLDDLINAFPDKQVAAYKRLNVENETYHEEDEPGDDGFGG